METPLPDVTVFLDPTVRFNISMPKSLRDEIRACCTGGQTVSYFVRDAIRRELRRYELEQRAIAGIPLPNVLTGHDV